jgi:hypothetical protein
MFGGGGALLVGVVVPLVLPLPVLVPPTTTE